MSKEEPIEVKKEVKEAKIVEVPSEYGIAVELEDGRIVTPLELQVLTYNEIKKIKKSVA
jgi:hypothetical protein